MTPQQRQRILDNEHKRKQYHKEKQTTLTGSILLILFACFVCIILSFIQQ